jgi:hypothetical protein
LRFPSLTQIICKEVTLFFPILQIVLIIPTALNIQHAAAAAAAAAAAVCVNATKSIGMMNQENAYHVQVRK